MVLSGAAQRVLFRLEIELLHHGGNDNGKLVVTFDQFEKYGVRRKSIAAALRELEALGFIEIVERGCAGNAGYGKPNVFRLPTGLLSAPQKTAATNGGASRRWRTPFAFRKTPVRRRRKTRCAEAGTAFAKLKPQWAFRHWLQGRKRH